MEGRVEGGAQKMGCVVGWTVLEESEQYGEPSQLLTHVAEEQGLFPLSAGIPHLSSVRCRMGATELDVCCPKWRVRARGPGVDVACQCHYASSAYAQRGNVLAPLRMAACCPHIMCLR